MLSYDYLIVGAGLYGSCFAHQATRRGKHCLVIDRRTHAGGNLYCEDAGGIQVHKYGAHIFHTSNKEVWEYVTGLTPFNDYINSPIADFRGERYNLPFNMNTFHQLWGVETAEEARRIIDSQRGEMAGREPQNLEEQAIALVGRDIYEKLIKGYTEKQWGRPASQLPAFIIRRLPVRFTFDNNYFNDTYQGIPVGGYNRLTDKMLEGVEVRLGCDYFEERAYWDSLAGKVVYTGPVDRYFDYRFGKLEYRTLRFEEEHLSVPDYQGTAVVNYTAAEVPYTRIIEHKHFEPGSHTPHTVITREYPAEWSEGAEPYYPVNDAKNEARSRQYAELAAQETGVIFGGRLAEFKYYDMHHIVGQVLAKFKADE